MIEQVGKFEALKESEHLKSALLDAITGLFSLTHIAGAVAAVALTARSGWGLDWA